MTARRLVFAAVLVLLACGLFVVAEWSRAGDPPTSIEVGP